MTIIGDFYFMPCAACGGRMLRSNMAAIYPAEGMIHSQCAKRFAELGFGEYLEVNDG
ncbi:hypothetical protein COURTHOUSE_183 [Mycobacterium phage Courthouse]|uniref:Uncharacterized protein n=2 Tax=Omegavirus courthouse TaxID=1089119 RepID=G8I5N9_9CAUD|nr:hypothetical protein CM09_gp240 [Mycobacterium phage Courthouse]YP_009205316.1 hypothetical protein AVT17_gp244 [Mycobacterium phage Ariel]YP_009213405.1 hypothetical protein AVV70_gp249 [Mycobacterium phage MiaZeal]ATS93023.1 hypothetical protein SEA_SUPERPHIKIMAN_184 [Mycobacterium phage Superphikiman]AER48033.1 hypothetical protein COURTHOUSE_183 [Mycobacterium phage Courthouse]AIM50063.1 hypothetical protein PBI_ARIEL_187 [Mycobacterium phage Ariel]AIY32542.1 hypothetical protein PBI_M